MTRAPFNSNGSYNGNVFLKLQLERTSCLLKRIAAMTCEKKSKAEKRDSGTYNPGYHRAQPGRPATTDRPGNSASL
jgi:hypothetical protein